MRFPKKIRLLIPIVLLPFLGLIHQEARAVPPGPFYRGTSAGAYYFDFPFSIPMGHGRKLDTKLRVRELMFSVPVAQLGKGLRLNAGGVVGRADLEKLEGTRTGFGKLGLTLQGVKLSSGVTVQVGARGKVYFDEQGKATGGADVGAKGRFGPAEAEYTAYDLLRKDEEVIHRLQAGVNLPHDFKIEGTINTESKDPTVAASKVFVLRKGKGGRPTHMVFPEVGFGTRTKTPYAALGIKAGRLTLVGVKEPYKLESGGHTAGTHVILSVDLSKLFSRGSEGRQLGKEFRCGRAN